MNISRVLFISSVHRTIATINRILMTEIPKIGKSVKYEYHVIAGNIRDTWKILKRKKHIERSCVLRLTFTLSKLSLSPFLRFGSAERGRRAGQTSEGTTHSVGSKQRRNSAVGKRNVFYRFTSTAMFMLAITGQAHSIHPNVVVVVDGRSSWCIAK